MKVLTEYLCDFCGESFKSKKLATAHEANCKTVDNEHIFGDWKKYIYRISSDRLVKLLYNNQHSYERCTYWNRQFIPKSVGPDGTVSSSACDISADSEADILSLSVNLDHIICMYNSSGTTEIEKQFLRHFAITYLIDGIDYRINRHHNNFLWNFSFIYSNNNSSNSLNRVTGNIFVLWYTMLRMGVNWKTTVASIKFHVKRSNWHMNIVKKMKTWLDDMTSENKRILVDFEKMPIFEKQRDNIDKFADAVVDYVCKKVVSKSTNTYPKHAGIRELGDGMIKILDSDSLKIDDTKEIIKIGTGLQIVKRLVVEYTTTTWVYIEPPPWFNKGLGGRKPSGTNSPQTHYRKCLVQFDDTNFISGVTDVIVLERSGTAYSAHNGPEKYRAKYHAKPRNNEIVAKVLEVYDDD